MLERLITAADTVTPTPPSWALFALSATSVAAAIYGLYKGFIETGLAKRNNKVGEKKGAVEGYESLTERLEAENLRMAKRVTDVEEAARMLLKRVRKLEDILHEHGIEIPDDDE